MALHDNIIHHMRFPKFLAIVSDQYGKEVLDLDRIFGSITSVDNDGVVNNLLLMHFSKAMFSGLIAKFETLPSLWHAPFCTCYVSWIQKKNSLSRNERFMAKS